MFGRLAETRAFVPPGTPLMACTATASMSVKKEVIESLEMTGCVEVTASPDRPNIYSMKLSQGLISTLIFFHLCPPCERSPSTLHVSLYTASHSTCVLTSMLTSTMSWGKHLTTLLDLHISVTFGFLACFMPAHLNTTKMSSSRAFLSLTALCVWYLLLLHWVWASTSVM